MSTVPDNNASTEKAFEGIASSIQRIVDQVILGKMSATDAGIVLQSMTGRGGNTDTTDICGEMIKTMRRVEDEKKEPWRKEAAIYEKRFNDMALRSQQPGTRSKLQQTFESRVKGSLPVSAEIVYILHYLLYCDESTMNPMLYLADALLNVSPAERLKMHNWCIQAFSPDQNKAEIAQAITAGKLQYPLYPCESLAYLNQVLANESIQEVQGAGPKQRRAEGTQAQKLFGTREIHTTLFGGGPQTSVNVYVPGNPEAVGLADTTQISDGMSEIACELNRVKEQNVHLKKNVQALERKIAALLAGPTYASLPAPAGNRGGYGGRGGWRGRAGGNRGGRGVYNNYQGNYRGGGEVEGEGEQLLITDGYEAPKNA